MNVTERVKNRLNYLRGELRSERISQDELAELGELAEYIEPGDVELLEAAGVPEFADEPSDDWYREQAEEIHQDDGRVEIGGLEDAEPVVSRSDEGAYVQAWVWVDNPNYDHG